MKHKIRITLFVLFASAFAFFVLPRPISQAENFNPDFIISDADLQDHRSMNRSEIQAFLLHKKSFLADYTAPDKDGKNKRAADILYDASQEYKISPKYLLVMLQKEQSLVLDSDPTNRQLDFATGYAVCDSCSFTEEKVLKYKGFGKQVDAAAGIMRWYYEHIKTEAWIKQPLATYAIDDVSVEPKNYATGFLYTYTPHIEGNKNFWKLWQEWFSHVYPDGTLLKAIDDPNIYLTQHGKKRLIKSMSALVSRFDPRSIVEVPAVELSRYPIGVPLTFANYSILEHGGTHYLLDFDTLRPFESQKIFRSFGYNPDEVIEINADDLDEYTIGSEITAKEQFPSGRILSIGESKQLYFVKSDTYTPLLDRAIAKTRFPSLKIENAATTELEGLTRLLPLTFPDATLVKNKQSGKVFVIENGKRRHITSEAVFDALGYSWNTIVAVDELILDMHPQGEPIYLNISVEPNTNRSPIDSQKSNTTTDQTIQINKVIQTIPPSGDLPYHFPETGKVILTPVSSTTYEGTRKLGTRIDVYLVADENGNIFAGKNIDVVRPMASFTKLMTAYRLFNEGIDLNTSTVYKAKEHKALYNEYRISEGESVKNDDLMKAMLVTSRNPPARMLVDSIEPDESAFIARMNAQAKNWGLQKTYFADTYGYDLRNQTTARDFIRIMLKTFQDKQIRDYIGITYFEYDETLDLDRQPHHAGTHTNLLTKRNDTAFRIWGSKTGFLNESGYNLAMLVTRKTDGKKFYILTMGEPDYATRDSEIIRLTTWALNTY